MRWILFLMTFAFSFLLFSAAKAVNVRAVYLKLGQATTIGANDSADVLCNTTSGDPGTPPNNPPSNPPGTPNDPGAPGGPGDGGNHQPPIPDPDRPAFTPLAEMEIVRLYDGEVATVGGNGLKTGVSCEPDGGFAGKRCAGNLDSEGACRGSRVGAECRRMESVFKWVRGQCFQKYGATNVESCSCY